MKKHDRTLIDRWGGRKASLFYVLVLFWVFYLLWTGIYHGPQWVQWKVFAFSGGAYTAFCAGNAGEWLGTIKKSLQAASSSLTGGKQ